MIDDAHKILFGLSSIHSSDLSRVGDDSRDMPWKRMNSQTNGGIKGRS